VKRIVSAALAALALTACGRGYSNGERAGVVTKFSEKGLVWKSWEGELNLGGMRSQSTDNGGVAMVANIWRFSVKDDRIVYEIQNALESGDSVSLRYTEWMAMPLDIDSSYEVTAVVPRKAAGR
jgi:hypothetical protein